MSLKTVLIVVNFELVFLVTLRASCILHVPFSCLLTYLEFGQEDLPAESAAVFAPSFGLFSLNFA